MSLHYSHASSSCIKVRNAKVNCKICNSYIEIGVIVQRTQGAHMGVGVVARSGGCGEPVRGRPAQRGSPIRKTILFSYNYSVIRAVLIFKKYYVI